MSNFATFPSDGDSAVTQDLPPISQGYRLIWPHALPALSAFDSR